MEYLNVVAIIVAGLMVGRHAYPVSSRVNHVGNDDEKCSAPVELAQIQNRLFP